MRGIMRSVTSTWTGLLAQLVQRFLAVGGRFHRHAPGLDHLRQPGSLILFVVRDQNADLGGVATLPILL